jgi:hypothetical protein
MQCARASKFALLGAVHHPPTLPFASMFEPSSSKPCVICSSRTPA